jgi:hypothetical protein
MQRYVHFLYMQNILQFFSFTQFFFVIIHVNLHYWILPRYDMSCFYLDQFF